MLNRDKELKLYYNISEVAKMFNVSETLLRYWEKEFPSIHPKKSSRNIRKYTKEDIEAVRLVYHLVKERGMTLEGARQAISSNKGVESSKMDVLDKLRTIRDELKSIRMELDDIV